jgi:hypothetical protein
MVHQKRRCKEVAESAWLLGIQLIVQAVPGPGDSVLAVLAGGAEAVSLAGQRLCESAWLHEIPQRAELVVASIEGPQQSWDTFARALYSASQTVVDQGAIVLCTGLAEAPGPGLQKLSQVDNDYQALQEIRRERSSDATAASLIAEIRQKARIYLLSQLQRDVVEELGVGFVECGGDIERLARQSRSCIVLGNAQHAATVQNGVSRLAISE